MRFVGSDVSVNHGAIVVINEDGGVMSIHVMHATAKRLTEVGRALRVPPAHRHRVPSARPSDDRDCHRIGRLCWWRTTTEEIIASIARGVESAWALEDYAHAAQGQPQSIAEVAGTLKLVLTAACVDAVRIYGVSELKLWATGRGNGTKADMISAALQVLPDLIHVGMADDIADAYHLAAMLRQEWQLRTGKLDLASLPEHQRRVWLKTSKTRPENPLSRPFWRWDGEWRP